MVHLKRKANDEVGTNCQRGHRSLDIDIDRREEERKGLLASVEPTRCHERSIDFARETLFLLVRLTNVQMSLLFFLQMTKKGKKRSIDQFVASLSLVLCVENFG